MPKGNVRESNLGTDERSKLNLVSLNPFIGSVANGTVTLMQYAELPWTIEKVYAKTSSGTCEIAIQIDGVAVTGLSAVSVSSTEASATASGANSVAAGETVTLVISNNVDGVDLSVSLIGELD
jgi:hypothetical protein